MLEALDRANLFLVPLDDRRRWYRYHHLFADVLRARLLDEQPDLVPELHRRASAWYEQNGERAVAIEPRAGRRGLRARRRTWSSWRCRRCAGIGRRRRCALAGGAPRRADPRPAGAQQRLRRVPACPPASSRGSRPCLRDAERWLDADGGRERGPDGRAEMVVVDEEGFRRLPSVGRRVPRRAGAAARRRGRHHGPRPAGARPRGAGRPLGPGGRGGTPGARVVGRAATWRRRTLGTPSAWRACGGRGTSPTCSAARSPWPTSGSPRAGSATRCARTSRRCGSRPRRAGRRLRGNGGHVRRDEPRSTASATTWRARTQHLLRSQELGEHLGLPQNPYRWRVAMARVREAEGDLDAALGPARRRGAPVRRRLLSRTCGRSRRCGPGVWIAQGRLDEALGWAREQGLSVGRRSQLPARVRAHHPGQGAAGPVRGGARGGRSCTQAAGLLQRLLAGGRGGGRTGSVIEILVLQALAHQARGDIPAALAPLERALALAEPEGYVRVFVDEGAADGGPARSGRATRDRARLRPAAAGRLRRAETGRPRRRP